MLKCLDDIEDAYTILKEAFPVSELRTYENLNWLHQQKIIEFYGYYDQTLKGVMLLWRDETYVFIENFAVANTARGMGIGSKMLNEVCTLFHGKKILLEVEKPYDQLSTRRIEFYKRNGFILSNYGYMQPKINKEVNAIPLLLMAYRQDIKKCEFDKIMNSIYELVYLKYKMD